MIIYYLKAIGWIIIRIILVLFSGGFAGAIAFLIEFIVSLKIPEKAKDNNWFVTIVVGSCVIIGIIAMIATAKKLF